MPIRVEEYLREDRSSPFVLFGGGTKHGQQRDIDQAEALLAEYKVRKKTAPRGNSDERRR